MFALGYLRFVRERKERPRLKLEKVIQRHTQNELKNLEEQLQFTTYSFYEANELQRKLWKTPLSVPVLRFPVICPHCKEYEWLFFFWTKEKAQWDWELFEKVAQCHACKRWFYGADSLDLEYSPLKTSFSLIEKEVAKNNY